MNEELKLRAARHERWRDVLKPRQAEILELVADGYTDPEAAAELHVETTTVKYHLNVVYQAIGIRRGGQDTAGNARVRAARWWWVNVERPVREVMTMEAEDRLRELLGELAEAHEQSARDNDYCYGCDHHPSSGHSLDCPVVAARELLQGEAT